MAYGKGMVKKAGENDGLMAEPGEFYLPHSCDEWVIGTREQAEQLIADLQELLSQEKPTTKED